MRHRDRCLSLLAVLILSSLPTWTKPAADPLPGILEGLDRASRLYLDGALRFTCDETIAEPDLAPRLEETFQYMFVHELDGSLRDYRMRRGEGQRPEEDLEELGFHHFMQRAYFWVLLFHSSRQKLFHYELAERGKVSEQETVKIRFEPIPPYHEAINDWFGTAWVDPKSFQIVRVEAMKIDSHEESVAMEKTAAKLKSGWTMPAKQLYKVQSVTSDFGKLKNGMRFPSRTRIVSSVYALPGTVFVERPDLMSAQHTFQTYRRYKFYSVRTKDEIRDLLHPHGEHPQGASPRP